MSEFIDILTHARRLNAATKALSSEELTVVAEKLQSIIQQRKEDEAELEKEQAEKLAKAERIRQQMEEAGLTPEEVFGFAERGVTPKKERKARVPRPAKYKYTDSEGNERQWTGQGRTPKPIQQAINAGGSLDDFLI